MSAPVSTTERGSTSERGPRQGSGWRLVLPLAVTFCVVAAAAAFAVWAAGRRHAAPVQQNVETVRPTGLPASISTPLADLMSLQPVPDRPAPDFTLTDQTGRTLPLSSFKGHPVVLEFMDPHCTDICPIVSQEFVDADRALRRAGVDAAFVAVNVNRYALSVADVSAFSSAHGLDAIPTWHFLTGDLPLLRRIWTDYNIQVINRGPNTDVIHSSIVYFIGPNGNERYLAAPTDEHTKTGKAYLPLGLMDAWGQGIARVTETLAR